MIKLSAILLSAALLTPALASAQTSAQSSATASTASSAAANTSPRAKRNLNVEHEGAVTSVRKDGKICHRRTETGTRLGVHTDCRTQREWDEMAHNAREDTELHQRVGLSGQQ